jgi:dihydrofolate reductase
MGKVVFNMSMSLDGFVAGPNDSPENGLGDGGDRLFRWYSLGDTEYKVPSGDREFKLSADSARFLEEARRTVGVIVYGRRTFDIARAWNGRHPLDVPMVIVTHRVPQEWVREGSPFRFVTDGVESAIEKAGEIAGDKNIAVGSASIAQQLLKVGLLDGIRIDLVPVLLGAGVRLFDHLGAEPIELESTSVTVAPGVTHLDYRVVK